MECATTTRKRRRPGLLALALVVCPALASAVPFGALAQEATGENAVGAVPRVRAEGGDDPGKRIDQLEAQILDQNRRLDRQQEELDRLREDPGPAAEPAPSLPEFPGGWSHRGDAQVRDPGDFDIGFGIQYRLMYNLSDLPGPGGTTSSSAKAYDFLRQRLRLNLSIAPRGAAGGGFVQVEFRGGAGGSSPGESDPRAVEPTLNPFNRLQARGVRYGYLWYSPSDEHMLLAGVLPLSDEFGDTLFSADWDFNLGGVAALGAVGDASYRLAYLRPIEGAGSVGTDTLAKDGSFVLVDVVYRNPSTLEGIGKLKLGAHAYYLDVPKGLPLGDTEELWVGVSLAGTEGLADWGLFFLANTGNLGIGTLNPDGTVASGYVTDDAHAGYAVKGEVGKTFDRLSLALQGLFSTGDASGTTRRRFVTPQGLLGTEGYWAYTHLFTANAPSDVNDLAVELGNGGAGLVTVQGRIGLELHERVDVQAIVGWFRAVKARGAGKNLGTEIGAMATLKLVKGLNLDVGGAGGFVGDFYGSGSEDLFEVFSRLQFQY